jgi:hypothetical protein
MSFLGLLYEAILFLGVAFSIVSLNWGISIAYAKNHNSNLSNAEELNLGLNSLAKSLIHILCSLFFALLFLALLSETNILQTELSKMNLVGILFLIGNIYLAYSNPKEIH